MLLIVLINDKIVSYDFIISGGERAIRTLGTFARSLVFETSAFSHSATSPHFKSEHHQFVFTLASIYNS